MPLQHAPSTTTRMRIRGCINQYHQSDNGCLHIRKLWLKCIDYLPTLVEGRAYHLVESLQSLWSSPHPVSMSEGYGYPARSFEQSYQCYPVSFVDKVLGEAMETNEFISNEDTQHDLGHQVENVFATNTKLNPFTVKQPKYVHKGGPRTVKAHRMRKWVEEDMTIESANTIEIGGNEQEPQVENGDKVLLPPSALDHLASLQIDYPMLFELYNAATERRSHCGVLEFTADEGMLYMPYWMMQNMLLQEGDIVKVKNATLPKGTYVKLQPHTKDFLDISNPKAVLETTLRNFSCLTTNDSIMVSYNSRYYYLDVIDTKPSSAISIIETDCELDIALPLDYKESVSVSTASCTPLSRSTASEETKEVESPKFIPFTGVGRRLDGKTISTSTTPKTSSRTNNSMPHGTISKSSLPRSTKSTVVKNPPEKLMFDSNASNGLPKDALKEVAKDEAKKDPPKFQAFTGKKYLLK